MKDVPHTATICRFVVWLLLAISALASSGAGAQTVQKLEGGITWMSLRIPVPGNAQLPVEIYLPEAAAPAPGVLVFPTYYVHLYRRLEASDRDYARALARQGYAVALPILVHYGTRAYHPDYGADLKALSEWFRGLPEVADERIGAIGFSLGSYMAARLATLDPATRAVVGYYGPYDVTKFTPWDADRATKPALNAAQMGASVLLLHGEADNETRFVQATEYRDALVAAGKTVELVAYPGAHHRFERGPTDMMAGADVDRRGNIYRLDKAARDDAWRRTLELLERTVR